MPDDTSRERRTNDDCYALYGHAHHDIWWAKTQEWSVANWTLLLIAGITGVGRALTPEPTLEHTRPYAVPMPFSIGRR